MQTCNIGLFCKKTLVNAQFLCYYAKANAKRYYFTPSWSSGQDVALSRRNLGFDSLWGYQNHQNKLLLI